MYSGAAEAWNEPRSLSGSSSTKSQSPRSGTRRCREDLRRQELPRRADAPITDPEGTFPDFPTPPPYAHVTPRGGQRTPVPPAATERLAHATQPQPLLLHAAFLLNPEYKSLFLRSENSPIDPNVAVHQSRGAENFYFYWLFFSAIPASCRFSSTSPGARLR